METMAPLLQRIVDRFAELNLHDSRLLKISIERRAEALTEDVHLDIALLSGEEGDSGAPARLTFLDCAAIELTIDFWAKHFCGDAIGDATCGQVTDAIAATLDRDPARDRRQPLSELAVFSVRLCPQSGTVRIIARDFTLSGGNA